MLKGFVSGEEKDIVRIPMKVGNEYQEGWEVRDNQDRLIWGREDELQTATGTLPFKGYSLPVKVKSLLGNAVQNGTPAPDNITVPEMCGVKTGNLAPPLTEWVDGFINGTTGNVSEASETRKEKTSPFITIEGDKPYYFYTESGTFPTISSETAWRSVAFYDSSKSFISRPSGTYDSPYYITAPQNAVYARLSYRTYGSVTNPALVKSQTVPTSYIPYGWQIPLTNAGQTIPVYLSEVPTVRRVKKLVLDGTEGWQTYAQASNTYRVSISDAQSIGNPALCSHFENTPISTISSGKFTIGSEWIYIRYADVTDVTDFKSYLASEYAAGTPVTIWYVLTNDQIAIVNEPLCKISTYADELTTIQVHGLSAPLYGIGDYKDTLNLSTGIMTRKVKRLVLDGTESYSKQGNATLYSYNLLSGEKASARDLIKCSHLPFSWSYSTTISVHIYSSLATIFLNFGEDIMNAQPSGNTVAGLKEYLAAQYAAGTPVTVWYVLAEPTTETVTVPTGMTGEIEGYLTQVSTPTPTNRSVPKWNGVEETGGTYAVTVYTPPEIPTTTGQNTLTVDTTLAPSKLEVSIHAKKIHYGFKIDKSNDNSEDAVIYTHDAVTMTPAHMDFTNDRFDYGSWGNAFFVRDCYPVALNLDGSIAYRLDPDDYTKKMDGTASDIFYELLTEEPSDWSTQWKQYYTKSDDDYVLNSQSTAPTFATDTYYKLTYTSSFTGNFMMAFPKVWFYRHEDSQYNYIEVSNHRLSDDWKCYAHINANGQEVDFIYLPLFKGVIKDSKLRSLPGQIPQGNTTATTEANAATALGSRWQIWDHSSVECLNDLLTLMSKSIDSQGRFGQGRSAGYDSTDTVTYGKLQSGTLIKKGKFHGYSATTKEVKVFGIEGFWANRWDRLQGMLLVDNVWKIKMTPPYNFTGTDFVTLSNVEVPAGNGYLSKVQTSEYGSIPASVANGSSAKYFKDYFYKTATYTRVAGRGGSCSGGGDAGFRYVGVNIAASISYWGIGPSPVYK